MPKYKVDLWMSQEYVFYLEAPSEADIPQCLNHDSFSAYGDYVKGDEKWGGSRLHSIENIEEMSAKEFAKEAKKLKGY